MQPKDVVDPQKQDGVEYKIPCECGKLYIGKMGRCMHEQIKEHDVENMAWNHQLKLLRFLRKNANKVGVIVCSGMRLSLFSKTLTGTFVLP